MLSCDSACVNIGGANWKHGWFFSHQQQLTANNVARCGGHINKKQGDSVAKCLTQ